MLCGEQQGISQVAEVLCGEVNVVSEEEDKHWHRNAFRFNPHKGASANCATARL